jgi:hypothetical protein
MKLALGLRFPEQARYYGRIVLPLATKAEQAVETEKTRQVH